MEEDKREEVEQEEVEQEETENNEVEAEAEAEAEESNDIVTEVRNDNTQYEVLKEFESKFAALENKLDNVVSMMVDSGAIIQDSVSTISEEEKEDYLDDFINIDEMDLSL